MPFPRRLPDGTPYLSQSQVKELLTCPARYRFRYIEGRREGVGVEALLGFAVHDALEAGFGEIVECGPVVARGVGTTIAADARVRFRDHIARAEQLREHDGADLDGLAREAGTLAELGYSEVWERCLQPVEVETNLVRPVEDFALFGRLDLLARTAEGRLALVDLKTAGRSPNGGRATRAHALQTLNYAPAVEQRVGETVDEIWVLYLVRNKTPKAVWCRVPATEPARAWATRILKSAADQVRAGAFPPNPLGAGFLCSPRFCGFCDACDGAPHHEAGEV